MKSATLSGESSEMAAALRSAILARLDKLDSEPLIPALYLVATPIGNLGDITLRALSTIARAAVLLCEDTRHSRKLLSAYGLNKRLEAYHDFSTPKDRARILGYLEAGNAVALVSDAGTPLIADPGHKLAREAIERRHRVFAIPGPSAVLAALAASGFPSDMFFFGGFLPRKDKARRDALHALESVPGTLTLFETAGRLPLALRAMTGIFPRRRIAIARELTKLHEEILSGTAAELLEGLSGKDIRGEIVLLVAPGDHETPSAEEIAQALRDAMRGGSTREAVEKVAKALGVPKKMVYNLSLKMRGEW